MLNRICAESFQLSISLAVSCMLLALTTAFVLPVPRRDHGVSGELDTAGILQLTWLLGNNSHLSFIARPTQRILREAGMFDIQLSVRMQKKMAKAVGNYEASELLAKLKD